MIRSDRESGARLTVAYRSGAAGPSGRYLRVWRSAFIASFTESGPMRIGARAVAAWTLYPLQGSRQPVELLAMRALTGRRQVYAVVLASIDRDVAAIARTTGLAVELSYVPLLVQPVQVATVACAQRLCEQLAHAVVDGTLPLPPAGDDDRATWQAVAGALVAALEPVVAPV